MIYRADLKWLSAKVGKKSSIGHNSLSYDFSVGVYDLIHPENEGFQFGQSFLV